MARSSTTSCCCNGGVYSGQLTGRYSISANGNWRMTLMLEGEAASNRL